MRPFAPQAIICHDIARISSSVGILSPSRPSGNQVHENACGTIHIGREPAVFRFVIIVQSAAREIAPFATGYGSVPMQSMESM